MEIKINELKTKGKAFLKESEFSSFGEMVGEIFIFSEKDGKTMENITDYLKIFSDDLYEIDWDNEEEFMNAVNTHDIEIEFPIIKIR